MFEYDKYEEKRIHFHIVVTLKITSFFLPLEGEDEEKPKALFVNGQVMVRCLKFNFIVYYL